MSMPTMFAAWRSSSSRSWATLMPPALPRPPICTCALTTHGNPTSSAAARASSTECAFLPRGTGTPCLAKSCLPWYSRRSMSGRAAYNAAPHAASQGRQLRHLRCLRHAHRLGDGRVRGVLEGGAEGRIHALEGRARPALPQVPAGGQGRILRALRRGPPPRRDVDRARPRLAARELALELPTRVDPALADLQGDEH